ncbi:MAG: hypothetical protein KDA28_04040 [Phycisphaerales bacterium]|nr:hypothetical protein [Phycisphaerales bacterium]
MQRALAAHMDLISALKAERISAEVDEGRVVMFVPDSGGVALRMEPTSVDVPLSRPPKPPPSPEASEAPTVIEPQPDLAASLSDAPTKSGYDPHKAGEEDDF